MYLHVFHFNGILLSGALTPKFQEKVLFFFIFFIFIQSSLFTKTFVDTHHSSVIYTVIGQKVWKVCGWKVCTFFFVLTPFEKIIFTGLSTLEYTPELTWFNWNKYCWLQKLDLGYNFFSIGPLRLDILPTIIAICC